MGWLGKKQERTRIISWNRKGDHRFHICSETISSTGTKYVEETGKALNTRCQAGTPGSRKHLKVPVVYRLGRPTKVNRYTKIIKGSQ